MLTVYQKAMVGGRRGISPIDPSGLVGLLVDLDGTAPGNTITSGRYPVMVNLGSLGQTFTEITTDGPAVDSASFGVNAPLYGTNQLLRWPHSTPTSYPFGNFTNLSEATLIMRVDQKTLNASGAGLLLSTMGGIAGNVGFHAKYITADGTFQVDTGNGVIIANTATAASAYAAGKHTIVLKKRVVTAGTQIQWDIDLDGMNVGTGTPFDPTASPQSDTTMVGNYVGGTVLNCNAVIGRLLNVDHLLSDDIIAGVSLFLENEFP